MRRLTMLSEFMIATMGRLVERSGKVEVKTSLLASKGRRK